MTNFDRADELAVASRRDSVSCVNLRDLIERALDEAEKRGYQMGFNEAESAKHDLTDCMKSWVRGQKDMRERAAKEGDKSCVIGDECGLKIPWCRACLAAKKIRALPIEGE